MKSLLTILLIAILMGGAVIGLLTMDHHGNCIASRAVGAVCPQFDILTFIGIHNSFLKSFSDASLIAVMAVFLSIIFFILISFFLSDFFLNGRFFVGEFARVRAPVRRQEVRWLSLFENSPNIK